MIVVFPLVMIVCIGYTISKECKEAIRLELAKVTSKGQITIPVSIRKRLGIKDGDKLLFIEKSDGVVMVNPTMLALEKIGRAFEGEAERLGLDNDDDVVAMIKEIRRERWDGNHASDA